MVNSGFNRAFGSNLRQFISKSTNNRFKALFSGIGVAMILQSSTAAALIVSSFAGRGLITVSSGIAVMLGADVGTALAAQILSFDLSWLVPILLSVGFIINKSVKKGQGKHFGRALIGIGLIVLALKMIVATSEPLRSSETIQVVMMSLSQETILAIIVSALLTWMAHSSLAMVLLFASLVSSGTIPVALGFAFILGANLGGAIAPCIMMMSERRAAGRRVPLANLLMRAFGVALAVPFIDVFTLFLSEIDNDPLRMAINFHTVFNVCLALLFIGLTKLVSNITKKIIPEVAAEDDKNNPRYLDEAALSTPPAALACATRETLRISDLVQRMLRDTLEAFKGHDLELIKDIRQRDNRVDELYGAVKSYLARLSGESLDDEESTRYMQILSFSTNLEHVGDIIDKNLMDLAHKKIRSKSEFSADGFREISALHASVMKNLSLSQNVFMSNDVGMARQLFEKKSDVREQEIEASSAHLGRIREGVIETLSTSSIHLDVLRDLRRINSYLSAIAAPILTDAGHLRSSRLRKHEDIRNVTGGVGMDKNKAPYKR